MALVGDMHEGVVVARSAAAYPVFDTCLPLGEGHFIVGGKFDCWQRAGVQVDSLQFAAVERDIVPVANQHREIFQMHDVLFPGAVLCGDQWHESRGVVEGGLYAQQDGSAADKGDIYVAHGVDNQSWHGARVAEGVPPVRRCRVGVAVWCRDVEVCAQEGGLVAGGGIGGIEQVNAILRVH